MRFLTQILEHVDLVNGDASCPPGLQASTIQEEELTAATGPLSFTVGKAPIKQTKQKKRRKLRKAKTRTSEEPDSTVLARDAGVSSCRTFVNWEQINSGTLCAGRDFLQLCANYY